MSRMVRITDGAVVLRVDAKWWRAYGSTVWCEQEAQRGIRWREAAKK